MNIFTLCWELDKQLDNGHSLESCQKLLKYYNASDYVSLLYRGGEYNASGYKRIHIFGSIHIDVFLIIWTPYSISPLHVHTNGGCIMKILTNNLKEITYNTIEEKIHSISILKERNLGYIEGNINQYIVSNPTNTYSISLHVYARN